MTKLQHSFKHSGIMVLKVLQHTVRDLSPLWNWEVWYSLKNNVITWVQECLTVITKVHLYRQIKWTKFPLPSIKTNWNNISPPTTMITLHWVIGPFIDSTTTSCT